ncbi:expressed unknown protein [Seminavis robusta]|uniref:Uncharacterized protein n=1 Tax=Seminavis robusta TaxID=568900 RepID=A0A9N8DHI8_9STRA|nr:expressed unknown protein [Seminavis robusta]|eukprot:Sro146_g067500.1 n/a (276) ;mRNA; f:33344-34171
MTSRENGATTGRSGREQLMLEAVSCNNQGVQHLLSARGARAESMNDAALANAVNCFCRSLKRIPQSSVDNYLNGTFQTPLFSPARHIKCLPFPIQGFSMEQDQAPFYIFGHVFSVELDSPDVPHSWLLEDYPVCLMSTLALFNMAVATHLKGVRSFFVRSFFDKSQLLQAEKFYQFCIDMVREGQTYNYHALAVLECLALNNQAQIAWHLFGTCQNPNNNIHQLMDALQAKVDVLLCIGTEEQQCVGRIALDPTIFGEIMLNIVLYKTLKVAGAA